MKTIKVLFIAFLMSFSVNSDAQMRPLACEDNKTQGGVDIWPWTVAQPFPWDNIEGYWKLGDDFSSYLSARVLSSTKNRKILSLAVHGEGVCSKPYAKGTGFIDVTDKNVVRALISDGLYKYQLKLAMFDSKDVVGFGDCNRNIMGASMQVIGRTKRSRMPSPILIDPGYTEMQSMVLKKVSVNVVDFCKNEH